MSAGGERQVKVVPVLGFKEIYRKLLKEEPSIRETMTIFNEYKRKIPPERLPAKMKDHHLKGRLDGHKECHLAADVLLIYTHENDVVTLIDVCRHSQLK